MMHNYTQNNKHNFWRLSYFTNSTLRDPLKASIKKKYNRTEKEHILHASSHVSGPLNPEYTQFLISFLIKAVTDLSSG